MVLAFPGQTGTMAEITAIDAFVDSFTDKELRKQVLQKSPATLAEALDTFLARFENFSSHFQWSEQERLFNLRNCLAKSVGNVLWLQRRWLR